MLGIDCPSLAGVADFIVINNSSDATGRGVLCIKSMIPEPSRQNRRCRTCGCFDGAKPTQRQLGSGMSMVDSWQIRSASWNYGGVV